MGSHSDTSADLHTHAKFAVQYKQKIGKPLEDRSLVSDDMQSALSKMEKYLKPIPSSIRQILTSYSFHVQYIQGVAPKTIVRVSLEVSRA